MTVKGMYRQESIDVAASPAVVYGLVSSLDRMGEWSPENRGGEWLDGGSGMVGDRILGHNKLGDFEWSVEATVTAAEPGEAFAFRTGTAEEPLVHWTYSIAASDDGAGCTLTETWDVEQLPGTLSSRTDEQLEQRAEQVAAGMRATLAAVKATAEG